MATHAEVQRNRTGARADNARRRVRKRKRNRTLHYMILLFFLLGAGAVLSFTVLFKIEGVEVIGVDKYFPDDIIAATGVELDENLLRINKPKIEENLLEQFPYIESVEIRRKLPPKVEITITQATPVGAILAGDEVVLISATGKVLERGVLLIPDGVPVVKGIDASGVGPGEILGEYTPRRLIGTEEYTEEEKKAMEKAEEIQERMRMLQYMLGAMEESGFTQLTNVDLTDRLNIKVNYENRLVLELGSEAQLVDKLVLMKLVLEEKLPDNAVGTVYSEINKRSVRYSPATGGSDQEEIIYSNGLTEDSSDIQQEDKEGETGTEL